MKQKSEPSQPVIATIRKVLNGQPVSTYVDQGARSITYSEGPKYVNRHCNWKACDQVKSAGFEHPLRAGYDWFPKPDQYQYARCDYLRLHSGNDLVEKTAFIPAPSIDDLARDFRDQIDLNCHDAVMLYSNIVQAVPLLGSIAKFNTILRKVGRWWKASKRRPFTEVINAAISADFIDRFVIKPTIDDARKFANATDYVIQTLELMHARNLQQLVPIESEANNTETLAEYSKNGREVNLLNFNVEGGPSRVYAKSTSKLFTLCQLSYDVSSVSAVKLALNRMGVTRVLGSLWDLVPFSFVADYFLKTGDAIEYLDNKFNDQDGLMGKVGKIYDQWMTQKQEITCTVTPKISYYTYTTGEFEAYNLGKYFTYSRSTFRRFRPPSIIYAASGDWEGGLLDVRLSSTRKRTLAELVIQRKLR